MLSGGRYISERCLQPIGNNKRLATHCGHQHRMHSTASIIKFETSHAIETSTRNMERTGRTASEQLQLQHRIPLTIFPYLFPSIRFQIEIDLDAEYRYHSIFACPILRQTSSEENPPMRLVCGHVISRDALNKLCNGPT